MVDFFDGERRAAIVIGHKLNVSCSVQQLLKLNNTIKALAENLGAPLALVSPVFMDNDGLEGGAVAGLVIAHAQNEQRPVVVDKARIAAATLADVPAALGDVLQNLGNGITLSSENGLFLCPGGWASASLMLGTIEDDEDWLPEDDEWDGEVEGDDVATCSSEDSTPIRSLANIQEQLDGADEDLILSAEYC